MNDIERMEFLEKEIARICKRKTFTRHHRMLVHQYSEELGEMKLLQQITQRTTLGGGEG